MSGRSTVLVVLTLSNVCCPQPLAREKHFDVLSDGRKVCHDCCDLVVLDTIEVRILV